MDTIKLTKEIIAILKHNDHMFTEDNPEQTRRQNSLVGDFMADFKEDLLKD
jgi:hypothetical protein